jgi:hypothetical protein
MATIDRDGLALTTTGLSPIGCVDLRVTLANLRWTNEVENFLRFVSAYIENTSKINSGETLAYGYWLCKFILVDDGLLDVYGHNPTATDFVLGINLTLTYWRDQHEVCSKAGAQFTPPRPNKLVVISEGVLEGNQVQGVRYASPDHMSGWWITTDQYNGDIKTLKTIHLYHLTSVRSDLARYIALPSGFRFNLESGERIWFDQNLSSNKP